MSLFTDSFLIIVIHMYLYIIPAFLPNESLWHSSSCSNYNESENFEKHYYGKMQYHNLCDLTFLDSESMNI